MVIRYLLILTITLTHLSGYAIDVRKMFHHKAAEGDQKGTSIELGSIVLYLDQYPNITSSVSKQGDRTQQTFFLPAVTTISKEAQSVIASINQAKNLPYSATIALKTTPNAGMEITLSYNDKQVGVSESSFDAISMHKGIVIRLYDKQLVKRIGKESKPIIQMACNNKPQVIIDCGHGGGDMGAIGCNKAKEKDISLSIGLQVADLLRTANITVVLTRDKDQTVLLDERTICANRHTGNLFVSIHANSAPNKDVSGIETYCIAHNLFKKENSFAADSHELLFCQNLALKYDRSNALAQAVHQSLLNALSIDYQVTDRHVRHSVAQVLLGTTMPAILVEVGYLSHEKEAALLAQRSYQEVIAQGIVKGLHAFLAPNNQA